MKLAFRIDLTAIEGEGEFPCPTCGTIISLDDQSSVIYEIREIETSADGTLQGATIQCRRCGSMIQIEGFDVLEGLGYFDEPKWLIPTTI